MSTPEDDHEVSITDSIHAEKLYSGAWCLFHEQQTRVGLLIQQDEKEGLMQTDLEDRFRLLTSLFPPESFYADILRKWQQLDEA
jgi:hypothetical protein